MLIKSYHSKGRWGVRRLIAVFLKQWCQGVLLHFQRHGINSVNIQRLYYRIAVNVAEQRQFFAHIIGYRHFSSANQYIGANPYRLQFFYRVLRGFCFNSFADFKNGIKVERAACDPDARAEARADSVPRAVLRREGPFACLGLSASADGLAMPVVPSATSLFGPRGASLMGPGGPLWVSDTGHHRLLGWASVPDTDNAPADWVIGQPDCSREGATPRQAWPATLNVPTGIAPLGDGMAVADAWNHRVLIWHARPECCNAPADVVLGQADFATVEANAGQGAASARSLFWPDGVHWDGARLWVADTGNRRVLMWHGAPRANAQPADLVLGQRDFGRRDENGGGEPSLASMRWPHGIAVWNGCLCATDAGNNRIMIWDALPTRNGQACDRLLGQTDPTQVDHNQSLYWPSAGTLHMPYGIAADGDWLLAADTANSRLLAWHAGNRADPAGVDQASACALTGQDDFHAKGDNRWALPSRDSLCWPYGISLCGDLAAVAESGNNRVLLGALPPS